MADVELLEPSRSNVLANHMPGHVAPAEAAEEVVEAGGEVREPPDAGAVDPSPQVWGEGRPIRHYELGLLLQHFARQRTLLLREGVICRHHRNHGDVRQKVSFQIFSTGRENAIDGKMRLSIAQALLGGTQAFG
jgi:hypothetical protein